MDAIRMERKSPRPLREMARMTAPGAAATARATAAAGTAAVATIAAQTAAAAREAG